MKEDSEIIAAIKLHGSQRAAAKALGMPRSTIQHRMARIVTSGNIPEIGLNLKLPDPYHLPSATVQMNLKTGEFERAWIKPKIDDVKRGVIVEEMRAMLAEGIPKFKLIKRKEPKVYDDIMATYIFGDPHFGMLSWNDETGSNWDLNIAMHIHCAAMKEMVSRAPASRSAMVVNLGDLCHYDNTVPETPKSRNVVDADGRYGKMIRVALSAMIALIDEALTKHEHVIVKSIPGNHDRATGQCIALMLVVAYKNNPRVTVEDSPSVFQYERFGNNLLGFHHGDQCKPQNFPAVMQADRRDDFAQTEHHFGHIGHFHHAQRIESSGCIVEVHRTLASNDAHAHNHGYRSGKSAVCIVYDRKYGEDGRIYAHADKFR